MTEELTWRKSSYSGGGTTNDCVELACGDHETWVRDTKNRDGGNLTFDRAAFGAFVAELKAGRFDMSR